MKYDPSADYVLTDLGREVLGIFRETDIDTLPGPHNRVQGHIQYTFLTGINEGRSSHIIYLELKAMAVRRNKRNIEEFIDVVFEGMIDEGLLALVDESLELTELPSAFKKDFGMYE